MNWIKYATKNKNPLQQMIPEGYQHPSGYHSSEQRKRIKEDAKFIERQLKVPGYKYEYGAFHFISNDPRTQWI